MCDEKIYKAKVYHGGPCGYTDEFIVRACDEADATEKLREVVGSYHDITVEILDLEEPYQITYGDI